MKEELLVTARNNPLVDPSLDVWTWEVAFDLAMGGLTAGIIIIAAVMTLLKRDEQAPFATRQLALLAPIVLSLGMTTLFMDLEYKLHVYRFYTSFQPTSPMSWGSWILLVIYPASALQILSTLRTGYAPVARYMDRMAIGSWILDLSERYRREIALLIIPFAIGLGIYTGILLSAFGARPFWNSGALPPLFLVSGLTTAAALTALFASDPREKATFTRTYLLLLVGKLALLALYLISLATGSGPQLEALARVNGGTYTTAFWGLFVGLCLLLPLLLGVLRISAASKSAAMLASVLVVISGYAMRQVVLDVGQESSWTIYDTQYSAELMERLR
jgi:formate-dependent nitrite reductase membrane component NrfD